MAIVGLLVSHVRVFVSKRESGISWRDPERRRSGDITTQEGEEALSAREIGKLVACAGRPCPGGALGS